MGEINLNIIDVTQLDQTDSYIVLFEIENEQIGYAHFRKGWNEKYKIEVSGHGGNNVAYQVIKTNNGTYGLLVGKNPVLHIEQITAKLMYEEFSFNANVSKEETFLIYTKLPSDVKQPFPAEIALFDQHNRQIQE